MVEIIGKTGALGPLRSAAETLANFEKLNPGTQTQEVDSVRQEILGRAATIHRDRTDALAWIDRSLENVRQWQKLQGVL